MFSLHVCRLLPLILIFTHILLLLVDTTLSKYTWSIFDFILWMVVCNALGRLVGMKFLNSFLLFHFPLDWCDGIYWNTCFCCLLSVCSICLHSMMNGIFGLVFDVTSCIAALESVKISAWLKSWDLGVRFSSVTSITLTSPSKTVPFAPIGI